MNAEGGSGIVRDPASGISLRFIKQYDVSLDQNPTYFDVYREVARPLHYTLINVVPLGSILNRLFLELRLTLRYGGGRHKPRRRKDRMRRRLKFVRRHGGLL